MKVTIENAKPYDGEYDLDSFTLSLREKRRMKEVSGLAGLELVEGLMKGDEDAALAYAVVAIERSSGRRVDVNLLLDAQGARIRLDFTPNDDEDADPLATETSNDSKKSA